MFYLKVEEFIAPTNMELVASVYPFPGFFWNNNTFALYYVVSGNVFVFYPGSDIRKFSEEIPNTTVEIPNIYKLLAVALHKEAALAEVSNA